MEDDIKTTPMQPIREVLRKIEEGIEKMDLQPNEPPCPKCNGTGTELLFDKVTKITRARKCEH